MKGVALQNDSGINTNQPITVMFAALNRSTVVYGSAGSNIDPSQDDKVLTAVTAHHGHCIKSAGNGSAFYFENTLDALRAAVRIQKNMDAFNLAQQFEFPVLMRIGMHSGKNAANGNAIPDDMINLASSLESAADCGGILMSEDTYHALPDQTEIYCRFVKQITLKEGSASCNAYQAIWNPQEIELQVETDAPVKTAPPLQVADVPSRSSGMKIVGVTIALIGLVLLLTVGSQFFGYTQSDESRRSISDSVSSPATQNSQP